MPNPFKPTAGKMPPILIGRENVVTDFAEGLENGAGAPSRLMLVSGQRGYGKTVLLVELARVALSYRWRSPFATPSSDASSAWTTAREYPSSSPSFITP